MGDPMSQKPAQSPTIFPPSLFTRIQAWLGERRLKSAHEHCVEQVFVDPFLSDRQYCTRLLEIYSQLKPEPSALPPRSSQLLSHVPEWTEPYQVTLGDSEQQFELETLVRMPRLQAALANCTSYTPSKWLLERELSKRRSCRGNGLKSWSPERQIRTEGDAESESEFAQRKDVYAAASLEQLVGIGLSGGGIRSATFCLGVLQTLAKHKLLGQFDYISSVSGGGYIHQWLAAWIHREPDGLASVQRKLVPVPSPESLARIPEQINWLRRYSSYLTPQRGLFSADTWTMAAVWFRNTFLTQIVLFSFLGVCLFLIRALMHPFRMHDEPVPIDQAWQIGLTVLAMLSFAWAGAGALSLSRALASQTAPTRHRTKAPPGAIGNLSVVFRIVVPGFLCSLLIALVSVGRLRLRSVAPGYLASLHGFWTVHFGAVHLLFVVWAVLIFAFVVAETLGGKAVETSRANSRWRSRSFVTGAFYTSALLCALVPISLAFFETDPWAPKGFSVTSESERLAKDLNHVFVSKENARPGAACVPSTGGTATGACTLQVSVAPDGKASLETTPVKAAPPIHRGSRHPVSARSIEALLVPVFFFALPLIAIRLQLGLLGRSYEESRREWLARFGAWSAIVSFAWLALGTIALLGPAVYYWFFGSLTKKIMSSAAVVLLHAVTLYSGGSSKTAGKPDPKYFFGYSPLDLLGIIGAPVAILCLLLIASGLVDIGIDVSYLHFHSWAIAHSFSYEPWHGYSSFVNYAIAVGGPVILFVVLSALLLLFGWRVDVNEFSLHPFYRDRLTRCYIGASNGQRVPDPFTGFDDHTEASIRTGIGLSELVPERFGGQKIGKKNPYDGPLPIFCSTVNLTFGEDLAFQDRKGASFAFTPLYTGYHVGWTSEKETAHTTTYNGFVPTPDYGYRTVSKPGASNAGSGIPLATVAAISGAALSPNQGFSSQPALAFLMTLFNVRLGWWTANPRKPYIWPVDLDQPTPIFGLRYLLAELFGHSGDTTNYVCLCDGGRFDNMGLYELVRRRCRLIVICDGEQDENTSFQGIGLAIAKARTDFGVEIEFKPEDLKALTPDKETQLSTKHFAVGTIQYPAPPVPQSPQHLPRDVAQEQLSYIGKIVYLKTSVTGDEPLDILHYKREHPAFPQESTLNQWFTEPQFECYRRLGQLIAEQAVGEMVLVPSSSLPLEDDLST
jgi:hypothetical protein